MQQKLVSIYLNANSEHYRIPGERAPGPECHGAVQEHLDDYLSSGWAIKSITGIGSASDYSSDALNSKHIHGCGWIIVLLEKS